MSNGHAPTEEKPIGLPALPLQRGLFFHLTNQPTMKTGFIFYKSWLDSMALMNDDERNELLWIILRKGLYNEDPTDMSRVVAVSWSLIQTQMDVNHRRYENAIQRRAKQNQSKTEANEKQNESKTEAKPKQNESKTVAKEKVKERDKEKEKDKEKVKVKERGEDVFIDDDGLDEFDRIVIETRRRNNLPEL